MLDCPWRRVKVNMNIEVYLSFHRCIPEELLFFFYFFFNPYMRICF